MGSEEGGRGGVTWWGLRREGERRGDWVGSEEGGREVG